MEIALLIIVIILLVVVIVLELSGRKNLDKKSDINAIINLLKEQDENAQNLLKTQNESSQNANNQQFSRFVTMQESLQKTLQSNREETQKTLREEHAEVARQLEKVNDTIEKKIGALQESNEKRLTSMQNVVDEKLQSNREETQKTLREERAEVARQLEKVNDTIEKKIGALQESNEKRLTSMQNVVDEKLQKTLETGLSKSFELVSKQLESVGQGLGEMKALAADAKSLKNVLTNVKERGTYGEVRLEKLLSDILTENQYEKQFSLKSGSQERVDFAIKLPGNGDAPVFLPIDSKFPIEDYTRLLDASDKAEIEEARKALAQKIRAFAKDISEKYIAPPKTTDFALMFLPTEGLYAEVVQNAALFEELRNKYKVTVVGATTFSAFLASLQIGFKTLAIERRSQEVWDTLRGVKKAFDDFEKLLEKAHKQLQTADATIENIVGVRTRAINKALKNVEEIQTNAFETENFLDFTEVN